MTVQQAMALHQAGRLADAEALYAQVLRAHPRDFSALHLMGLLRQQQGRPEDALAFLETALAVHADQPDTLALYGVTLHQAGRAADGLAALDRALAQRPTRAEDWNDRGTILSALGRLDDALASHDKALALDPALAPAWNNRGSLLLMRGDAQAACDSYDRAVTLMPDYAEALGNRSSALLALARPAEALASADAALALTEDVAAFHDKRGAALAGLHRSAEALESFDRAVALQPGFAAAWSNRAPTLLNLLQPDAALESADRALALTPQSVEAHNNRAAVLSEMGRFDDALQSYDAALALRPGYAQAWSNKAIALLTQGRDGWPAWRRREDLLGEHGGAPGWTPDTDLTGKTLFIEARDGFGDAIQFCRYFQLLKSRAAKVIVRLPRALHVLLRPQLADIAVIAPNDAPPGHDYHASLFNLAEAFAPGDGAPAPYLAADPERWRIGAGGFRIGVAWQGAATDPTRSFAVDALAPLAALPGVRLISLQKDAALPSSLAVETLGADFDAGADAFLDTAAAMQSLDLIVTPDTAIAHLAGALGRPAFVALKAVPDWRWGLTGDSTLWYPSLTLFRQPRDGDWASVFAAMAAALKEKRT